MITIIILTIALIVLLFFIARLIMKNVVMKAEINYLRQLEKDYQKRIKLLKM